MNKQHKSSESETEELVIRYDGRAAEHGVMSLNDLTLSLRGWESLIRTLGELNIRREFSVPASIPDYPLVS